MDMVCLWVIIATIGSIIYMTLIVKFPEPWKTVCYFILLMVVLLIAPLCNLLRSKLKKALSKNNEDDYK